LKGKDDGSRREDPATQSAEKPSAEGYTPSFHHCPRTGGKEGCRKGGNEHLGDELNERRRSLTVCSRG